jgi:predicted Rossmann fold flavoprotein
MKHLLTNKNREQSYIYDVVVIGGGASGMIAAGTAGARGLRVLLIEKNPRLGEKLRISGGGRCNILNAEIDQNILLKKYGKSEKFLYSIFSNFGMLDTYRFFESKNLPLKIEALARTFPQSEKAIDVVHVLEKYMNDGKVEIRTNTVVTDIVTKEGAIKKIRTTQGEITAQNYILATGGLSHPETGSTGDGFSWLRALGHTVIEPTPTIVPLKVRDQWIKKLSGKSLPDVKITFFVEGKKSFSKKGTILCTHFGISGPVILNSAGKVSDLFYEGVVTASIDLYPVIDLGILDTHIREVFDKNKNKILKNVFKELVPLGTSEVLLSLASTIDPETKVHSILKEQRRILAELLKNLPLTIEGLMGFDRAVVADGGVPLQEIDMRTMRSEKVKNLFVTGDLLHIQRPSGGYSLQLCWTTGYASGSNA